MNSNSSFLYLLIFFLLFFNCDKNTLSQNEQPFLDQFVQYQEFQNWYNFWNDSFPELDIKDLNFNLINSTSLKSSVLLGSRIQELHPRAFTLNFFSNGNYAIDVYPDVSFSYPTENDSIFVTGRDVDPALMIYNFKDSVSYYYTDGPTAFYDESLWLSDTNFVVFGISFSPGQESYQQLLVIKSLIKNGSINIDLYLSEKIPWKSGWTEYMHYKHSNITFKFSVKQKAKNF